MEDLPLTLIEKYGEENIIKRYIEKSNELNTLLIKHFLMKDTKWSIDINKDYLSYVESYNKICEQLAEVEILKETIEFMFNNFEVNKYYDIVSKQYENS